MIDKDKLFAASGLFPEFVSVPLPGYGEAKVKVLNVAEKGLLDDAALSKKMGWREALLMYCVIEDSGARQFNDDDLSKIENLPYWIVEPLAEAAVKINRMSKDEQDKLAKNSNGQSGDSHSG